jgi:CheY-like chemotaxis protein
MTLKKRKKSKAGRIDAKEPKPSRLAKAKLAKKAKPKFVKKSKGAKASQPGKLSKRKLVPILAQAPANPAIQHGKLLILLVEDDQGIREGLQAAFEGEGYLVHAAQNGAVALEYLKGPHEKIALIFLDTMMPIMDGFAFRTEQLKLESFAQIPTILYSADERNRKRAIAIGLPFLTKPFGLSEVFACISEQLAKKVRARSPGSNPAEGLRP